METVYRLPSVISVIKGFIGVHLWSYIVAFRNLEKLMKRFRDSHFIEFKIYLEAWGNLLFFHLEKEAPLALSGCVLLKSSGIKTQKEKNKMKGSIIHILDLVKGEGRTLEMTCQVLILLDQIEFLSLFCRIVWWTGWANCILPLKLIF